MSFDLKSYTQLRPSSVISISFLFPIARMACAFLVACVIVCTWFIAAHADTLTISDATDGVRHYGPSFLGPEYTAMAIHADITPSGSPTTAVATQGATTVPLTFDGSPTDPNAYGGTTSYSSSLLGAWSITASNGPNSAGPTLTNTIPYVEEIPLLEDLTIVSGGGLTPTLTWTLPDLSGFDINTNLVTVFTTGGSQAVFNLGGLGTTFAIPSGVLVPDTDYYFDVTIGYYNSDYGLIDDSETFTQSPYDVSSTPLPSSVSMLVPGLACLAFAASRRKRFRTGIDTLTSGLEEA
jgi:hypothetical protein